MIIDFLYFANIVFHRLAYTEKNSQQQAYQQALGSADFLFPDGIALELLTQKYLGTSVHNLNGTDFLPFFLRETTKNYNTRIFLYGSTATVVQKAGEYVKQNYVVETISVQNGFHEYDWSEIDAISAENSDMINIFLVGRGTPRQELWIEENRALLKQYNCITFAVGGLLDFWSGTEQRAPLWIRNIRSEWLYRMIFNPKKNLVKALMSFLIFWYLIR